MYTASEVEVILRAFRTFVLKIETGVIPKIFLADD